MAVETVSLSPDPELVAEARELAGRRGLSAPVDDALRVRLQRVRGSRLLDEMDVEFGPVPGHVRAEVAREWPDHPQSRAAG
jgi:hypothetical protein